MAQQVRIVSPMDGDLLNFHDGCQDERGLTIRVSGVAPAQKSVVLCGTTINADAGVFCGEVTLTEPTNTITVTCGDQQHSIVVYWDRHARRRYRFSTDDNIYWLRDLATHDYRSLFENRYLAFWRELHQRYGVRVNHNIYWCEPEGFTLPQLSDRYRGEWADNADWLHLTFHAEQDLPNKPYLGAPAEKLAGDFDKVTNEILRFAGDCVLSPYTTVHWGEATFEGCCALADRGLKGLAGYANIAEDSFYGAPPGPVVSYYLDEAQTRNLAARDAWRDHRNGLWFIKHDIVSNTMPPAAIRPHLDSVFANPHRRELMEVMIHEQYFCEFLTNYQSDVHERVTETVEWLVEHDYQSIFYEEGCLGSPE